MKTAAQITFHGIQHSDALEAGIREQIASLEQFHDGILGCRVVTEIPNRHHQSGRRVHVHIELSLPGQAPILVTHEPTLHGPLKDVEETEHHKSTEVDTDQRHAQVALKQAFDAARRQLQERVRERRDAKKAAVEHRP